MSAFLTACGGVLTVSLVGLVGYLLARGGMVGPEMARNLPRIITNIVLPLYLFRNITSSFEREQLLTLLYGAVLPFVSIAVTLATAAVLARLLGVRRGRRGIFRSAFTFCSAVNIGLPVSVALFGEEVLTYALLYFIANVTLFWTFGNYGIARDGHGGDVRLFSKETLKCLCSPPLMGFFCGMCLVLLDIRLPVFLDKAVKYVGDMSIGLAIMYVGIMLHGANVAWSSIDRDVVVALAGRFFVAPACLLCFSFLLPVPPLMRKVFIIQSMLPVLMQIPVLAGYYGADARYATIVTSLSTLLCLAVLPLYMVLVTAFL